MGITHPFVCALPDNAAHAAAGKVVTTDWNAEHVVDYLTLTHGTITAAQPTIDASVTWNNAGVAFTGWKLNVTDTASAAGSLLADWQVGGASKASIQKNGLLRVLYLMAGGGDGGTSINYYATGIRQQAIAEIAWTNGGAHYDTVDLALYRDAAAVLAQRNGTNAQTHRVYGTYTDSSNYVRASLAATSTTVTLAAETAGTGADNIDVTLTPAGTGVVASGSPIKTQSTTVASLMSAATAGSGARAFVTDATATTFLSTVAGGGANKVPVVSDGTNWLIG